MCGQRGGRGASCDGRTEYLWHDGAADFGVVDVEDIELVEFAKHRGHSAADLRLLHVKEIDTWSEGNWSS